MVFGRPGSGKSTFADLISKKLHLPVYHLDRHFFMENWIERDTNEFLSIQENLVKNDQWIIDGNAIRSLEMRFARADMAIYFNYPKILCLWRVIKRLWSKNPNIKDRADGCYEKIRWVLVKYLWNFEKRIGPSLVQLRNAYPHVVFHQVTNDRELDLLLEHLIAHT